MEMQFSRELWHFPGFHSHKKFIFGAAVEAARAAATTAAASAVNFDPPRHWRNKRLFGASNRHKLFLLYFPL